LFEGKQVAEASIAAAVGDVLPASLLEGEHVAVASIVMPLSGEPGGGVASLVNVRASTMSDATTSMLAEGGSETIPIKWKHWIMLMQQKNQVK
jgi:hypothetical protein